MEIGQNGNGHIKNKGISDFLNIFGSTIITQIKLLFASEYNLAKFCLIYFTHSLSLTYNVAIPFVHIKKLCNNTYIIFYTPTMHPTK